MAATVSPSAAKPYGLARVCRALERARSTVDAHRQRAVMPARDAQKRGPRTASGEGGARAHPTALPGSRVAALEPIRQGIREHDGSYTSPVASGLVLRHDNGSPYASTSFPGELRVLGIESSPAYVREPEGNGVAERVIRTLKEQLLWMPRFETVAELERGLHAFKQRYNRQWLVSQHDDRTPHQARAMLALESAA